MKEAIRLSELKALAASSAKEMDSVSTVDHEVFGSPLDTPVVAHALAKFGDDGELERLLSTHITLNGYSARAILRSFFEEFFSNIRDIVCGRKGKSAAKTAEVSTKGIATALAVWMTSSVGVSGPTAIALSTMALIVIGTSAKQSFCEITQKEFLESLRD